MLMSKNSKSCFKYYFFLLTFLTILFFTSCEPKEKPVSHKIEFTHRDYPYKLNGNAVRTRNHKTISLKIVTDEGNFNPVVNINVAEYTNSDNFKNIPDNVKFSFPNVNFALFDRVYYEAFNGELTILKDDDKIITGTFEFRAVNKFDTNDTIYITNGKFELEYLPSVAVK